MTTEKVQFEHGCQLVSSQKKRQIDFFLICNKYTKILERKAIIILIAPSKKLPDQFHLI